LQIWVCPCDLDIHIGREPAIAHLSTSAWKESFSRNFKPSIPPASASFTIYDNPLLCLLTRPNRRRRARSEPHTKPCFPKKHASTMDRQQPTASVISSVMPPTVSAAAADAIADTHKHACHLKQRHSIRPTLPRRRNSIVHVVSPRRRLQPQQFRAIHAASNQPLPSRSTTLLPNVLYHYIWAAIRRARHVVASSIPVSWDLMWNSGFADNNPELPFLSSLLPESETPLCSRRTTHSAFYPQGYTPYPRRQRETGNSLMAHE
jgi:hypothetical protein